MRLSGNTVLITGGATGIGFALASEFVSAGSEVIICGRREQKLQEAKSKLPSVHTRVCDLSKEAERDALFKWVNSYFGSLNVLINNAGIQRMILLKNGESELKAGEDELEINLNAPIRLSAKFIPLLSKQKEAAIINVSSGLGFVPIAAFPVYCATKAAIHSFCLSLRHQLKSTPIKVFEIIPPTVDSELDHGRRGNQNRGIPASEFSAGVMEALKADKYEFAYGLAENLRSATGEKFQEHFNRMNSWG